MDKSSVAYVTTTWMRINEMKWNEAKQSDSSKLLCTSNSNENN